MSDLFETVYRGASDIHSVSEASQKLSSGHVLPHGVHEEVHVQRIVSDFREVRPVSPQRLAAASDRNRHQ